MCKFRLSSSSPPVSLQQTSTGFSRLLSPPLYERTSIKVINGNYFTKQNDSILTDLSALVNRVEFFLPIILSSAGLYLIKHYSLPTCQELFQVQKKKKCPVLIGSTGNNIINKMNKTRGMQIKTTMKYHLTVTMALIK